MLTKFARTAAGNPHAGNLGRKGNCSILTHIQEEGRKGIEWWPLLQMFKNFSAKISACRKPEQTDNLLVPAMERSGPTASTDGAALLLCLHTELISLRWMILPLIQPKHTRFLLLSCISGSS